MIGIKHIMSYIVFKVKKRSNSQDFFEYFKKDYSFRIVAMITINTKKYKVAEKLLKMKVNGIPIIAYN